MTATIRDVGWGQRSAWMGGLSCGTAVHSFLVAEVQIWRQPADVLQSRIAQGLRHVLLFRCVVDHVAFAQRVACEQGEVHVCTPGLLHACTPGLYYTSPASVPAQIVQDIGCFVCIW